jgi:CBS domain-containing protein
MFIVTEIMNAELYTLEPDACLQEARDDQLVGIVTDFDFVSITIDLVCIIKDGTVRER